MRGVRGATNLSLDTAAEGATEAQQGGDGGKPAVRKRVLSGVQPTGSIHMGNYLGAIKNWVALQEEYDTFYCVVDLHAITMPHDPKELLAATRSSAAVYMACGVDPAKANVFVQSHVPAHAELTWLLNCVTPMGWLNRMIQFKEKSRKQGSEDVTVGLLDYPVLMASDILLYDTDLVPVREDQRQHLELARDIAARVNSLFGGRKGKKMGLRSSRVLKQPDAFIPPAGARVMSLTDGTAKMSKSNPAEGSRINLLDPPDVIAQKVKRCKTDAIAGGLTFDDPERPEATNLLTLYQLSTGLTKDEVVAEVGEMSWGQFKPALTDALVAHLEPIQARYAEIADDQGALDAELKKGADAANEVAQVTLDRVKTAMGFTLPM